MDIPRFVEARETAPPRPVKAAKAAKPAPSAQPGPARHAYLAAFVGGLVWAGCFIAFVLGFQHDVAPLTYAPFQAVILAMLTVLPAAFLLFAAFAVRQGARLAADARATRALAEELAAPASLAAARTGGLLEIMRQEIERAGAAGRAAHDDLSLLRESLAAQTGRLTEAAAEAQRTARVIGETLAQERDAVTGLVAGLQAGAQDISRAVQDQTRLVADASDLARSQLQEAEAALAARAADLNASSASASAIAREASERLARDTDHLDAAAAALAERLRLLDARLGEQRTGLAGLMQSLDIDQDDIAARLESRRAQLVDTIVQARVGAAELVDASDRSADTLKGLITAAGEQATELARLVEHERTALIQQASEARTAIQADLAHSVGALGEAVHDAYRTTAAHADQASLTAAAHVEAAKAQVEQLGELAFNAGQKANQAFDARISEARKLIEQSAALVEEAGVRSASRIETGLDATRSAMEQLAATLSDIDVRMAKLPEDARARAQAIRAAVDHGVGDLAAAARRVAEETQAIDAAFQDRVKRNYETLSEAVRLMARVAGPAAPPPQPAATTAPPSPPAEPAVASTRSAPASPTPPTSRRAIEPTPDFIPPQTIFEREVSNGSAARPRRDSAPPERKAPAFLGARARPNANAPTPVFGRAGPRTHDDRSEDDGSRDLRREEFLHDAGVQESSLGEGRREGDDRGDEEVLFEEPRRQPSAAPPLPEAAVGESAPSSDRAFQPGLRPRLKLTPTEADAALKTVFDPLQARGREAEAARSAPAKSTDGRWEQDLDEWTWRDLLSSIDETPASDDGLANEMIREISALGIDAGALLPRGRLEEIATALKVDDPSSVRDSVRRLAPAAIRRLSRRVLTDTILREQADRYVRRYDTLVRGSLERDQGAASALLGSDSGRAYLLLDAAVGDLQ